VHHGKHYFIPLQNKSNFQSVAVVGLLQ